MSDQIKETHYFDEYYRIYKGVFQYKTPLDMNWSNDSKEGITYFYWKERCKRIELEEQVKKMADEIMHLKEELR